MSPSGAFGATAPKRGGVVAPGAPPAPSAPPPLRGEEFDGGAVDAVAQACWLRAVVEDVAQVATAVRAGDLGPDHEQAAVDVLRDRGIVRRRVEARPAAVRVELGL